MPQFRPEARIRRRADFREVYQRGIRSQGRFSTVFILATTRGISRLGIAATKKLGGAVQRNRAKRLIRELFRRNPVAPGFDIVIVPRPELLKASFASLEADHRSHLERRLRQLRAAR